MQANSHEVLWFCVWCRDFGIEGLEYYEHVSCQQYDINFTQVYYDNNQSWPEGPSEDWPISECLEGWTYDRSEYKNTLVTELDLVCDNQWWPKTSTTLFYVGSLFGNIIFGYIADK